MIKEPKNKLNESWHSTLSLEKDETVLDTWEGGQKEIRPQIYGDVDVLDRGEGLLVLTNQTLMWLNRMAISEESGYSIGFRIPLEKISDITYGVKPISHLAITDDKGVHVISPSLNKVRIPVMEDCCSTENTWPKTS